MTVTTLGARAALPLTLLGETSHAQPEVAW
jgi:hypothetical protein